MDQSEIDKLSNYFSGNVRQEPSAADRGSNIVVRDFSPIDARKSRETIEAEPPHTQNALRGMYDDRIRKVRRQHNSKYNPYAFSKLSDEQKVSVFLGLYEQLIHAKAKLQEEVQTVKQLKTQLHMIEHDFAKSKKIGEMTAPQRFRVEKEKDKEYLDMKNENRRLLEKINALTVPKKVVRKSQHVVVQKKVQKTAYPVNEQMAAELDEQRNTVKSLLEMIQGLKRDKLMLEQQLKEKQRGTGQSMVNASRAQVSKESKVFGARIDNQEPLLQELANEKERKYQLELAIQRLTMTTNEKISSLQSQLQEERENRLKKDKEFADRIRQADNSSSQARIVELTRERDRLEGEVRRMVSSPFYTNNKDVLGLESKIRDLESRVKSKQNEVILLKESAVKTMGELDFKKKQVANLKDEIKLVKKDNQALKEKEIGKASRMSTDHEDYYRKALGLAKWEGDDPIWKKYSTLAKPEFELLDQKGLRQLAERLWSQKLEILAHLQAARNRLKADSQDKANRYLFLETQKAKLEEKLSIAVKKIDEYGAILSMRKGFTDKIYDQNGVKYDDSVSVFSTDADYEDQLKQLDASENYLDLYLGEMILEDLAISQQAKGQIRDIKNLMSFLTVDFYNHDTDHTQIAEGLRYDFRHRMSFRVQVDQTLISYFERDSIKIELWGSEGSAAPLLGTGNINLKELVARAQDSISPVVHSKVPIYGQDHVLLGVIDYRVRMRLPISPLLKWMKDRRSRSQKQISYEREDILAVPDGRRKLSIIVERALNLPDEINAFVYYTIQHQDCFSDPQKGPSPMWDFHRQLELVYSEQFQDQLKSKFVEFTIFDDLKPMGEDVYGVAQADFTPLLTSPSVELKLEIRNAAKQKVGLLMLKAMWML